MVLNFSWMWLASILGSYIIDWAVIFRMLKDIADNGYKLKDDLPTSDIIENNNKIAGQLDNKTSDELMDLFIKFVPILNLMFSYKDVYDYNANKEEFFYSLMLDDAIEEMSPLELKIYNENPSRFNAFFLEIKAEKILESSEYIVIRDYFKDNKIYYDVDEKTGEVEIVQIEGPMANLSEEKALEILNEVLLNLSIVYEINPGFFFKYVSNKIKQNGCLVYDLTDDETAKIFDEYLEYFCEEGNEEVMEEYSSLSFDLDDKNADIELSYDEDYYPSKFNKPKTLTKTRKK